MHVFTVIHTVANLVPIYGAKSSNFQDNILIDHVHTAKQQLICKSVRDWAGWAEVNQTKLNWGKVNLANLTPAEQTTTNKLTYLPEHKGEHI